MEINSIIIKKPIKLTKVKKIGSEFLGHKVGFIRETGQSYRVRNIPKTKFKEGSFRTKKINDNISIVMGKLKI